MDVLTDILTALETRSSLYFTAELTAPWGLDVPPEADVCRFHVMASGHCRLTIPRAGRSALLSQGDMALVPHGAHHTLQDDPETPVQPLAEALSASGFPGEGRFRWGGGGGATRMVCGHFAFTTDTAHALLASLPPLVHVTATPTRDFAWTEQVTRFLASEASSEQPGAAAISGRLSEILFILALRHWADQAGDVAPPLSGIADPQIGRALRAMHRDPGRRWTLELLAREAAQSRTAFAERFAALVGMTPMRYLTDLRMREARRLLAGELTTAAVADRLGYRSEAAFHRRFREVCGVGPGAYRRRRRTAQRSP